MMKAIFIILAFTIINGCYVPPTLIKSQEVDQNYVIANQNIEDFFMSGDYILAVPRGENDLLNVWILHEDKGSLEKYYELKRNCNDYCSRIIVRKQYYKNKNFIWITFSEFTAYIHTPDGRAVIKNEKNKILKMLKNKTLDSLNSIKIRSLTLNGICPGPDFCQSL